MQVFTPIRYVTQLQMESYFSASNNTKHLVSSQTLINPSTLSNVIRNAFAPINVLYEML